jgi:hypothetical protein
MGGLRVLTRIEQPMEVNDEIPHMGVVDSLLSFRLPGYISSRVVGKEANDFDLSEILESIVRKIGQFATDDEVQQLLLSAI